MAEAVTLKEVAAEAGVHVSTASRALNPETRSIVNEETAIRVLEVAERLGYRPHPLARGLRTNRTLTVGMVVPDLMNPLFPPIYAGADSILGNLGYSVLVASDDGDVARARSVVVALLERRVDGLILANAHHDFTFPKGYAQVPVVLVNRSADAEQTPAIVGDDHHGVGLVVRHLAGLGHRAIAHVAGPKHLSTGLARREGFITAMGTEGLEAHPALIVEADAFRTREGQEACQRLLDSGEHFTAVIAANDLIALGCCDALAASGVAVPDDVSVTGYNDMTFVDRVAPALTTVAVDYREMGAVAARTLLDLLDRNEGAVPPHEPVRLAPTLVVRKSTGPPAG